MISETDHIWFWLLRTYYSHQGIIDKAKVDAFNLPIYAPSPCEMRNVIEKNGCFSIERIEMTIPSSQDSVTSSHVHSLIMHLRAALEGIFTKHLENDVVDKMFNKTLAKSEEISALLGSIYPISTHLFLVLKRKYWLFISIALYLDTVFTTTPPPPPPTSIIYLI